MKVVSLVSLGIFQRDRALCSQELEYASKELLKEQTVYSIDQLKILKTRVFKELTTVTNVHSQHITKSSI